MTAIKDDIMWNASIKGLRATLKLHSRIGSAKDSLASLKNQTGIYAEEHRALIRLYEDIANAIDVHDRQRHDRQRRNPES